MDIGRLPVRFLFVAVPDAAATIVTHGDKSEYRMTDDKDYRMGGIALIVAAVGGLVTMSIHPTGADVLGGGHQLMTFLGVAAHTLAIATMPVGFLGALSLSRRLDSPDRLSVSALVVYGFALVAGMAAAAMSGFVATNIAREIRDAAPSEVDAWRLFFQYTGMLNHAFALVLVVGSSSAIVLWSIAILKNKAFARGIAIYGLVLGPVIILAVLSGQLRLHLQGFGLVVVVQALWFILVGTQMYGKIRRVSSIAVAAALLTVLLVVLAMHLVHANMSRHSLRLDKVEHRSSQAALQIECGDGLPNGTWDRRC
jgi:hypothetical protein